MGINVQVSGVDKKIFYSSAIEFLEKSPLNFPK